MTADALAPLPADRWNARTARHLLNRAGFGIPHARVQALAAMSPEAAVDSLLEYPESNLASPGFVLPPLTQADRRTVTRGLSEEERRAAYMERQQQERMTMRLLKGWWLEQMVTTPDPLEEKLTLMWHGHFATSAQKVRASHENWELNQTLRRHSAGNLRELTTKVGQSAAMLRYLDNATSTREHPNENWARELLELFTLGTGNYTEQDIKEAARAFTGWATNGIEFAYRRRQHDDGPKEFLGKRGNLDGHDIIDIVFEQPACARHFATRLWTYFGTEVPNEAVIESLAATLRAHDYELRPALRQLFLAESFYDDAVVGAQIKSPAQLAVQLVHDLQLDPVPVHTMADTMARLGQDLFYPPNVKGWDGNSAWVNANAMLLRVNLPATLVSAGPNERRMAGRAMQRMMAPDDDAMAMQAMMADGPMGELFASGEAARHEGALMAALAQLPSTATRERIRAQVEAASSRDEQYEILERALRRQGQRQEWRPGAMLAGIEGDAPVAEALDQMIERFIAVPLAPEQRALLNRSLAFPRGDTTPQTLDEAAPAHLRATLQLLLSTAEYQLC